MIEGPAARRVKSGCQFYQPSPLRARGSGGHRTSPPPAATPLEETQGRPKFALRCPEGSYSRSNTPAAPMPVPMHMLIMP
ncbi:hypothetical protein ZRA01_10270 [Zoogloea ramigera]|uniref:Uncharacterized protein n=1 Tax=Zoogloea ramigera TaxID=350 RepID=A0A4Y4CU25_ZOORA|nr:hypothetical protein ZRA01_10270 [Zoogloea ramigera]